MATEIKQTPIIRSLDEDFLCWKLTPSGKCNTKSAYKACLQKLQEQGEPMPRQVRPATIQLLNQIWKDKHLTPRVKTFGWRFLRRAMPTGARSGKYSKHISKLCARCGVEEDDVHLFFTCPFSKAAWFTAPWFIRSENLVLNNNSLTHIMQNFLNMNHPHASLSNILTFMWCIWKTRNDNLFDRKPGAPNKINLMAQAIKQNLEMVDVIHNLSLQGNIQSSSPTPPNSSLQVHDQQRPPEMQMHQQGETIKNDLMIRGSKIFSDAAWKTRKVPGRSCRTATGIGVYCQLQEQDNKAKVLIQASMPTASSVLQAEAAALLLATQFASLLSLQKVTFLTDNSSLARAAAAGSASASQVLWEIRSHIADYLQITQTFDADIFHVKRDLNENLYVKLAHF